MSWIKFEIATSNKPEVLIIADRLKIDPDAVVGKLLRVWAWFDIHTTDGNAPSVTKTLLNRDVGITNFTELMIEVGWMLESNGTITVSKFENHNGETAKARAQNAKRVGKYRKNAGKNDGVMIQYENRNVGVTDLKRNCNAETVTKVTPETTSEKRREEDRRVEESREEKRIEEIETNTDIHPDKPDSSLSAKRTRRPSIAIDRPDDIAEAHWRDWTACRRKPVTESVLVRIRREAAKAGISADEAIRTAAERQWEGFQAEWLASDRAATERKPSQPMTFTQIKEKNTHDVFDRLAESGEAAEIIEFARRTFGSTPD